MPSIHHYKHHFRTSTYEIILRNTKLMSANLKRTHPFNIYPKQCYLDFIKVTYLTLRATMPLKCAVFVIVIAVEKCKISENI